MIRAALNLDESIDPACSPDEDDVRTRFTRLLRYKAEAWMTVDLKHHAESLCYAALKDGRV